MIKTLLVLSLLAPAALAAPRTAADVEAEIRALRAQIDASKARETTLVNEVIAREAGSFLQSSDAADRARGSEIVKEIEADLTNKWQQSKQNADLQELLQAQTKALHRTETALAGKDDPDSARARLEAQYRVYQAEVIYFNARDAFTVEQLESYWRDLRAGLAESYGQFVDDVAKSVKTKFIAGLEELKNVRDLNELLAWGTKNGAKALKGLTTDVFKAGLKEAWVKSAMVDMKLPRYFAAVLFEKFVLPERGRKDSAPGDQAIDSLQSALYGKLRDKMVQNISYAVAQRYELVLKNEDKVLATIRAEVLAVPNGPFAGTNNKELMALLKVAYKNRKIRFKDIVDILGPTAAASMWDRIKDLPAGKQIAGSIGDLAAMNDLKDIMVQAAALATNVSDEGSSGAIRRGADDYRRLAEFLERYDILGVNPAEETQAGNVLEAVFGHPVAWDKEAAAFEAAWALQSQRSEGGKVAAVDLVRAWSAVLHAREKGQGETWPPFARIAADRVKYFSGVKDGPGAWARWRPNATETQRNHVPCEGCSFDHGDDLTVIAKYQVAGVAAGERFEVAVSQRFGERAAPDTRRTHKQDDLYAVELRHRFDAKEPPGTVEASFGLGDASGGFDQMTVGIQLSSLFPRLSGMLADAEACVETCHLKSARTELDALNAELAGLGKPNALLSSLGDKGRALGRRIDSVAASRSELEGQLIEAQSKAGVGCAWDEGLRRVAAARRAAEKLPGACVDRPTLERLDADLQFSLASRDSFRAAAKRCGKAGRECLLEEDAQACATAAVIFRDELAGFACPDLAQEGALADARAAAAEARLAERDDIAGRTAQAQEFYRAGGDVWALEWAQLILSEIAVLPEERRACLEPEKAALLRLMQAAGENLPTPDPGKVRVSLPADPPKEVSPEDRDERRRAFVADEERRDREAEELRERLEQERIAREEQERIDREDQERRDREAEQAREREAEEARQRQAEQPQPQGSANPTAEAFGLLMNAFSPNPLPPQGGTMSADDDLSRQKEELRRQRQEAQDQAQADEVRRQREQSAAAWGTRQADARETMRAAGMDDGSGQGDAGDDVGGCSAQLSAAAEGDCSAEYVIRNSGYNAITCGPSTWIDFNWDRAGVEPPFKGGGMRKVRIDKACTRLLRKCQASGRFPC
ncbi:MAG: hypothetical protein HZB91_03615 [Elusimicrobia bacterium]|nr:hypothetical protein [Elusimicrobiota bacterium]